MVYQAWVTGCHFEAATYLAAGHAGNDSSLKVEGFSDGYCWAAAARSVSR